MNYKLYFLIIGTVERLIDTVKHSIHTVMLLIDTVERFIDAVK